MPDGWGLTALALVTAVAGIGLFAGLAASRRRPRSMGLLAVASSGAVLAVYGFLLVFFGIGGSR